MGHLGESNVRKLEGMATGIKVSSDTSLGVCGACMEGRQERHPSKEAGSIAKEVLGRIFSDLCGPITPTSLGGTNYCVMFHDQKTWYTWIYPLKSKKSKEVLECFQNFKAMAENKTGKRIKILRTDGGGEYQKAVGEFLRKEGIVHETTVPYTPQQNGLSERANHTVME